MVPVQGLFKLIASVDEPYATIGGLTLGLVAGVGVAVVAERERLTVRLTNDLATLVLGSGRSGRIPRSTVDSVFLDGRKLVLVGHSGEELAREATDVKADRLAEAFTRHGFAWRADGDPYRDDFRLWVDDMPGLPAGANALLKARAAALAKASGRRAGDVTELRRELQRLGVVVREEKRRQYYRLTTPPLSGTGEPAAD